MPVCDDCWEAFPFDDYEGPCLCPSCREHYEERRAAEHAAEEEDFDETSDGGAMEDG